MSEMEKMDEFERALTEALRRADAPEGFAGKVMGRAYAEPTHDDEAVMNGAPGSGEAGSGVSGSGAGGVLVMPKRRVSLRMQAWMGGAVAAVLALGMFGAGQMHLQREKAEQVATERAEQAAAANQQFEAAVRVTDHALAQTREQLQRAGLNLGE